MPIGDQGDFRMVGFRQVLRFGAQDVIGGEGSAALYHSTKPYGSTNGQFPVPPLTFPSLQNPTFTLPGITLPPTLPPVVIQPTGTGTGAATTITVEDIATPTPALSGIDTIQFTGSGLVSVTAGATPNIAIVNYQDTGGGGGGGSTLVYGKISSSVKGANAIWTYTVAIWAAGGPTGSSVTAYNLLEKNNTATVAYGYTVSGAGNNRITGTSFFVNAVPNGTDVRMEYTDTYAYPAKEYWFSAPNLIDGAC